jgi:uncharacterized protein (TIGR03435 family)
VRRQSVSAAAFLLAASGWAMAQGVGSGAGSGGPKGGPRVAAEIAKSPDFDVISVKPSAADTRGPSIRFTQDGFTGTGITVQFLLREGFQLGPDETVGEPDWAKSQRWDISAKVTGEDVPALKEMSFNQRRQTFVRVVQERFGLKYHMEKRELPVFVLALAKGGSKMTDVKPEADGLGKGGSGQLMGRAGNVEAHGVKMELLASMLSNNVGRPVVDKTGLSGQYTFTLAWAPDQGGAGGGDHAGMMGSAGPAGPPPAGDPGGPSLFTALQEQLGLKLEPQKSIVDVVVIDHLEKPSEN